MVWPTSGCINKIAERRRQCRPRVTRSPGKPRFSLSARKVAAKIAKAGFRNSEGYNFSPPKSSQRCAPFTSSPPIRARNAPIKANANTQAASTRVSFKPNKDVPTRMQMAVASKNELLQRIREITRNTALPVAAGLAAKAQHQPDERRARGGRQGDAVDGPPPARKARIVGTGNIHASTPLRNGTELAAIKALT